jgi:FMN reductase
MKGHPTMRVLAVVGSPEPGGKSAAAAASVLVGARGQGADTELVELAGRDYNDEVQAAVERADGIVFAAPVYRARAASPLKTFLDRLPRGMWGESNAPLRGKACAIVLTGATLHHFLALDELRGVLASFFAAQVLSPGLYMHSEAFTEAKELSPEWSDLAAAHGAALVDLAKAVRDSKALSGLRPLA